MRFSKSDYYSTELRFLKTNYIGWWCGLWRILIPVGLLEKANWKFKILINGCYTGLDNIPDKRKDLQEPPKITDLQTSTGESCMCNWVQQEKGAWRLKIYEHGSAQQCICMTQERFRNVTVLNPGRGSSLSSPGRGTLGIFGWGSAAGTLEPIAYTRTSWLYFETLY